MHIGGLLLSVVVATTGWAAGSAAVQSRVDSDTAAGRPLVVHVVVALCDNANQGIVRVPRHLGNGQDPATNLYWGALYGLETHLPRAGGWTRLDAEPSDDPRVLDRAVLYASVARGTESVSVYLVADAWNGANIRASLQRYLDMAAGHSAETLTVTRGSEQVELRAGGAAHLLVYVGHNGLMDFSLEDPKAPAAGSPARSAVVLACRSKSYFLDLLRAAGAHPLLLTTGLMAPEAYTLDSAVRAWVEKRSSEAVVEAAAGAYDRYQKCGLGAARRLFWGGP